MGELTIAFEELEETVGKGNDPTPTEEEIVERVKKVLSNVLEEAYEPTAGDLERSSFPELPTSISIAISNEEIVEGRIVPRFQEEGLLEHVSLSYNGRPVADSS